MVAVGSWGRLGQAEHEVKIFTDRRKVARDIQNQQPGLAYGMGRSYGDVCLNPKGLLWQTTSLDRFISFDEQTGCLECEAGVLLGAIQTLMVPRGWMLAVTPGTQLITVGGAIANDVHGKNHHDFGSFGDHIKKITLIRTNGEVIECGPTLLPDWFAATVGGVGLTGFILTATLQLRPVVGPWMQTETIPYASLDEFFSLADASATAWEHTVAWIDCHASHARGLFIRGNHSALTKNQPYKTRQSTIPLVPPISLMNALLLRPFNKAYFNIKKWQAGPALVHYEPFLYPLDKILQWNRIYGPKGFYQYQCVVPRIDAAAVIQAMLRDIANAGAGSFLSVLKTFGDRQAQGMLSFTQPGVTLALDFSNQGERSLKLFERLDAIVREACGRLYIAKDARMPRELFEAGYPRLTEFLAYRDPGISSGLSRRLMGQ
ncbi:MAG: FAD-dependent oxidoreductase [Legionellales bacterium]